MKKIFITFFISFIYVKASFSYGTYYDGEYVSRQKRYSVEEFSKSYSSAPTLQVESDTYKAKEYRKNKRNNNIRNTDNKLSINGGIRKEYGNWNFDMNTQNSILNYNNLDWNIVDLGATYDFLLDKYKLKLDVNFEIGKQGQTSTMTDDDITRGGMLVTKWTDTSGNIIGDEVQKVLSIGESKDGTSLGLKLALGLKDFFVLSNMLITPKFGYKMFSYHLTTTNNNGISITSFLCKYENGQKICDPIIIVEKKGANGESTYEIISEKNNWQPIPGEKLYTQATGSFFQPTSHDYKVSWNGPFVGTDMKYNINNNNIVKASLEIGLPIYKVEANQPYREDLDHPLSFVDTGSLGQAISIDLLAEWKTKISDVAFFSIGATNRYYSVKKASATTYYNKTNLNEQLSKLRNELTPKYCAKNNIAIANCVGISDYSLAKWDSNFSSYYELLKNGGMVKIENEIDSIYKSMGLRIGLDVLF